MITVKQYAEERNITIQAVHQSMKGKQKKELLSGHVYTKEGVKWLDEEAVEILDKDRRKPPVLFERAEANDEIERLKEEKERLLLKIAAQADTIAQLSVWKAEQALAIAESSHQQLLLENTQKDLDETKAAAEQLRVSVEVKTAEINQERIVREKAEQELEQLRAELEAERNRPLTIKERLFGRRK